MGYVDDNGLIYMIGRKKEILKYKGFHVSPAEIENIINEIDLVLDSCVVGILSDDGNDITYAAVRRKDNALTEEIVIQYVNGRKN